MGRRPRRAGRRPRRAGWTTALGHRPARGRDRAHEDDVGLSGRSRRRCRGRLRRRRPPCPGVVHGPRPRGHEKLKPAARSARSTGPGHAGTRHRQHLTRRPGRHGPRPRGHEGAAFIERSQVMRGRAFRSGGLHSDCRRTVRAMRDDSLRLARPRGVGVAGSLDNSLRRRRVRSPGQQGTRGAPRCRRPAGRERQPGTAGPALFGLLGPCCNSPSGVVPQRGQMVDSREGLAVVRWLSPRLAWSYVRDPPLAVVRRAEKVVPGRPPGGLWGL